MTDDARKTVRADSDLPAGARLLFEQIWEMHHASEEGCYAGDQYLAKQIGAAPSSVRRYRRQLREKGYLTEQKSGGRRRSIPIKMISTDQNDQEQPVNTDHSDQNCTDDVISTDQDISSNNPEGTRESAPAHEAPVEYSSDELFSQLVKAWRSVSTAPPLSEKTEDVLWGWAQDQTIDDPDLFREVLEEQSADTTAKGCGLSTGILLKEYRNQRDSGKLEPWQKESEHYSVDGQGRVCFKGVPVEDTGPQDVYADRKDGSAGPEPEVSAA